MAFQPYSFPANVLGLVRGIILEATDEIVWQIGLKVGDKIVLGYDGAFVCCGPFDWSLDQIVGEIQAGVWKIVGRVDLSSEEFSLKFAREIENLPV